MESQGLQNASPQIEPWVLSSKQCYLQYEPNGYTVNSRYLALVGSQNSRARVKWFSRYLALSREGHDSRIQDHRPTLPGVYNSQTVCWAIIEVLTFPRSLHTHRHHTSDKSQQATLDFNNYATKLSNHTCKATHDGFCVEISQTTSRLDRKQKWFHACVAGPAWPRFTKVGWASRWQFANRISNN